MSFLSGMDISASGLTAQRARMDVISDNIANIDTTRTAEGGAYRRKYVVLQERNDGNNFSSVLNQTQGGSTSTSGSSSYGGVRVQEIGTDQSDLKLKYDPTNPDANADGYVEYPNVDVAQEMTDMMSSYRSYEANVTAFNAYKDMAVKSFEIGQK
jgi:flagellar basal-body rod protein FlgC